MSHSYLVYGKDPLFPSFALDDENVLYGVLGLLTILAMVTTIDFQRGTLSHFELQLTFVLQIIQPGKDLLDGISLNKL